MVEHLDRCPDCYEVVSESARFLQEASPEGRVVRAVGRFGGRRLTWAVAAVAAVLLVAVLVPLLWSLHWTPPAGHVLLASWDLAGVMGRTESAARAVRPPVGGDLAFAGVIAKDQLSFRIGVQLLDAWVAIDAGDRAAVDESLNGLGDWMQVVDAAVEESDAAAEGAQQGEGAPGAEGAQAGGAQPEPESAATLHQAFEATRTAAASGSLRSVRDPVARLEVVLETRLEPRALALGKWTEAGRLAATAGDRELFADPAFTGFRKTLDPATMPDPAREALKKIDELTAAAAGASPEDLSDLAAAFRDLELAY